MSKTGVLLINLGTPEAPTEEKVRDYLQEFLMDKWVIDIPWALRWFFVNKIILKNRPAQSAALYQKIWTEEGSPLLMHSKNLEKQLQKALGEKHVVALGMRYGRPSIESALARLEKEGVSEIKVLPLYPQYSLAATASSVEKVKDSARKISLKAPLSFSGVFYDDPGFLNAFTTQIKPLLDEKKPDHVIFSFHGLPERQVKKCDVSQSHCLKKDQCCEEVTAANKNCYRAQSFATARKLAKLLNLKPENYSVSFQSRLGRTPWIKPYTDVLYEKLARAGVKNLLVVSPSFVADCLETLEEIALRGRDQFLSAGGQALTLVPSLNSHPTWVEALAGLIISWRAGKEPG